MSPDQAGEEPEPHDPWDLEALVVDASVLVTALADDGDDGDLVRARLRQADQLHVPELTDLEVLSVLRRHHLAGRLDRRRAELAVADLATLPLARTGHVDLIERIWQLRDALTPYDAAYVALAELVDCPLVTADGKLARGAEHARSPVKVDLLG
jgi:predicted nucleic acid-binding protein